MRTSTLCTLLVATISLTAHAGFVDKRVEPLPVAPAASSVTPTASVVSDKVFVVTSSRDSESVGTVIGYLDLPGWAKPAPDVGTMKGLSPGIAEPNVAFGDAIFRLLPPGQPPVVLDGPQDALSTPVTWSKGLTRRAALDEIATTSGLLIQFTGDKPGATLKVSKAAVAGSTAAAELPVPVKPAPVLVATAATASPVPLVVTTSAPPAPRSPAVVVSAEPTSAAAAVAIVVPPAKPAVPKTVPKFVVAEPTETVVHTTGNKLYEVKLSDIRLSTAFERWGHENNVRIRWDADKQVLVEATVFSGTNVLDAIGQALLTPGIANSDYPLEACEYPNTPKLIRITRRGEQAKDCPQ